MIPRLYCAGVVVVDVLCRPVDGLPQTGGLALIEGLQLEVGGNAANVAAAYVRLGGPASLCGCVGADYLGDFVDAALTSEGVDLRGVRRSLQQPTASTVVMIDSNGERSFLHCAGANRELASADITGTCHSAEGLAIAGVGLLPQLHGDGLAGLLKTARGLGVVTFLDTVLNPAANLRDAILPALREVDWFVPSAIEAERITGCKDVADQVDCLMDWGARGLVVKCGEQGCLGSTADGDRFEIPAFDSDSVDSLGAGDAWLAGFAAGILTGRSVQDSARCANRVGADCVSGVGARAGLLPWASVLARLGLG